MGRQTITVQLPIDIQCRGGRGANLCIASFITTSGYGNCVVFTLIDVHTDDERKRDDKVLGITVDKRESVDVDGAVDVSPTFCSWVRLGRFSDNGNSDN